MVDFYERIPDPNEALQLTLDSRQTQIWTAQPGIIAKISDLAGKITVDVQPAVQGKVRSPDGKTKIVALPIIPDVPVVFPHGGGYVLTFPIAIGDEVLIVHAARNIDGWWQNGGINLPLDSRLHDLTDAFAIPGPYSQAKKFTGLSTTTAQLRTEDGTLHVELDAPNKKVDLVSNAISLTLDSNANVVTLTGSQTLTVNASSSSTITIPTLIVNSSTEISLTGGGHNITISSAGVVIDGIVFSTHQHTGVQTGTGLTGGAVA
jgi:hypothetical protein